MHQISPQKPQQHGVLPFQNTYVPKNYPVTSNLCSRRTPEKDISTRNGTKFGSCTVRGSWPVPAQLEQPTPANYESALHAWHKCDFRGGPRGSPGSRGPPDYPSHHNITSVIIVSDDDLTHEQECEKKTMDQKDIREFTEALNFLLPTQRIDEICGMTAYVGQTLPIRPTATSMNDLTFGCFLSFPDVKTFSAKVDKLRRDMLLSYWPKNFQGILPPLGECHLNVGTLVAVNFPDTTAYYRGVIISVDERCVNIVVHLLDAGIDVHVRPTCLFPLFRPFTEDPPFAITCRVPTFGSARVDETYYKLTSLWVETRRKNSKVEVIICEVVRRNSRHPNIRACLLLEVMVLIDGVDIMERLNMPQPEEESILPEEVSLIPPNEYHPCPENYFHGADSDQFHVERIERYSF